MIKRILNLARKNEKLVIVDPETERAFVILPLSVYERLVDEGIDDEAFDDEEFDAVADDWVSPEPPLTEQSLIDSIDRDIAAWKAAQEVGESEPRADLDELTLTPVPGAEAPMTPPAAAEEEKFYIEPVA